MRFESAAKHLLRDVPVVPPSATAAEIRAVLSRRRYAVTGVLIGIGLAGLSVVFVLWRWGKGDVALVLGVSLFCACSCATLVAMGLPWLLQRLARDPAFGSGPLATVIQDLLSIAIYLMVANLALG